MMIVALLQVVFAAVDGPASAPSSQPLNLDDLRELALRELPRFSKETDTIFIATGFDEGADPVDPTQQFLERFTDLNVPVQPASKAERVGKVWNEEKRAPGEWYWKDPETGKRARIYYVTVMGYRGGDEARVTVGFTSGPLSGGGREVIYRFVNNRWVLDRVIHDFIS